VSKKELGYLITFDHLTMLLTSVDKLKIAGNLSVRT